MMNVLPAIARRVIGLAAGAVMSMVIASVCLPAVLLAHEIGTTRVSVTFPDDGRYRIEVVTDASSLLDKLEARTQLLVDESRINDWKVISTEFDFIEPDKKKNYRKVKLVINPEDITTVSEQIKSTWAKIQNREFYTGCGKPDCHWCNFVKNNNLAVALHEIIEEDDADTSILIPEA